MIELLDKIIGLNNIDNDEYISEFPNSKPIFEFNKASDSDILNFENRFDIKFPKYLADYFKYFNPIKVNLMFVEILGLQKIANYYSYSVYLEVLNNKLIPISDEDGDLICVNSDEDTGKLYYYSHEDESVSMMRGTLKSYLDELVRKKEYSNKK